MNAETEAMAQRDEEVAVKIRPMASFDEPALQAIYALCHPSWPPRSSLWWWAHPTLVLEQRGEVIGGTSFSVALPPTTTLGAVYDEIGYGQDVLVHPDHRGKRLGVKLAEARFDTLRELGIGFFIGMTQPGNQPMIRIFDRQGLTFQARIEGVYPDGEAALMYAGVIR